MVSLNLAQDEHQMTVKKNIQEEWRIYTRVSSVDMSQNVRVSDVPILRSEQLHIPGIVMSSELSLLDSVCQNINSHREHH